MAGKAPHVYIDSPIDISEHVGVIGPKGFADLKEKLVDIVSDTQHNLFFHRDKNNIYQFDESALHHGGVYGLKERRAADGDPSSKLTASKLVPIKSPQEFKENVELCSTVKY